ncbi:hypothetical protein GALMADRAFT_748559 [Galerina marginata CBS 339.88]|uniref:Uncharacterized protein n=1 Tax=Galerina marginata (strain CBS 339.88) TaxID=685588 RepID=A0A067SXT5_GALM3|nr:hypothetical protein GALMADRAFT_748559 [Galerina marginata CBS 339.88]
MALYARLRATFRAPLHFECWWAIILASSDGKQGKRTTRGDPGEGDPPARCWFEPPPPPSWDRTLAMTHPRHHLPMPPPPSSVIQGPR